MTDELKKEWDAVLEFPKLYLYGAARTAQQFYKFISNMNYQDHIKGFLVTDSEKNVTDLCGLPVIDIHEFYEKNARILVPHLGIYKEQIRNLLEELGFENVFYTGVLSERTSLEANRNVNPPYGKINLKAYNQKSEAEMLADRAVREQVLHILQEGKPDFGSVQPYQSMEQIGLKGIRSTEYRITFYGLKNFLKMQDDVLDIGCNVGFLDLSISSFVRSVTGIEFDRCLVKVANIVKNYLGIANCKFYGGDFNIWEKTAKCSYNVVLSFAIHHWLNLSPAKYVAIIDRLLADNGYLCFESHIYGADKEFEQCYKMFLDLNYQVKGERKINDDGTQERMYVLFQKGSSQ